MLYGEGDFFPLSTEETEVRKVFAHLFVVCSGAGEAAPRLRTFAALVEDSSTHVLRPATTCNSRSKGAVLRGSQPSGAHTHSLGFVCCYAL